MHSTDLSPRGGNRNGHSRMSTMVTRNGKRARRLAPNDRGLLSRFPSEGTLTQLNPLPDVRAPALRSSTYHDLTQSSLPIRILC